MIIFRYLSRELLATLSAVTLVLLVIIMSGRFIKYLAQAAQGMLDPGVLLMVMLYRLPGFLELILPLGLFLGILLTHGRMYLESEMAVLAAAGVSSGRILRYTCGPALLVALVVAALSLDLGPRGLAEVERILGQQDALTEFDTLAPGRFQSLPDGSRVTYTESLSDDRRELRGVFISEISNFGNGDQPLAVVMAERGHQVFDDRGHRYLVLENGYRYDGRPGQADYRITHYETYGALLARPEIIIELSELSARSTLELWNSDDPELRAELQWRLSLPVLVFVVALLATPLARVNPRQGRFLKLLPAVLLYMAYLAILMAARDALEEGHSPELLGLWWVHGIFALLGWVLFRWDAIQLALAARRGAKNKELLGE